MRDKNLTAFLDEMVLENKAFSTIDEYERRIQTFLNYLKRRGITDLTVVTQPIIVDFQQELLKKQLNPRTINAKISTLSVFYQWAQINGLIAVNPVPMRLSVRSHPARIERLSDQDLQTFISWANTLQDNLRAAFWLMYGSGARVGEVAKLTYSDISLQDKRVYLNITDAKWGSDRRVPVMDAEAARIVWQFRGENEISKTPIFRVVKRTLQTYATQFSQTTGIPFHCHLLRHTFAARLLENGVPITTIQYLLGHKTLNMTAHYTQSAVIDVTAITPTIFQERGTVQHERHQNFR